MADMRGVAAGENERQHDEHGMVGIQEPDTLRETVLSTRALFLSFTRSVSANLSLCASILALSVKVLSINARIRSRLSLLCVFVASPRDASAAQPRHSPVWPLAPISADNTQNILGSASGILSTTFFVNFNSGATICHGVPHKPCQFVASHSSLSVCVVQFFASRNSVLGDTQKLLLFDHGDQQRFFESRGLQTN